MADRYENFTARALAWAAEHPNVQVRYETALYKDAKYHTFNAGGWQFFSNDNNDELIDAIEIWENRKKLDMTELPPYFDLLYDIKYMYQVDDVCRGCSSSSATPVELLEAFYLHNLTPSQYLLDAAGDEVWLCNNGTWITHKPLPDEIHNYVRVFVDIPKGFRREDPQS